MTQELIASGPLLLTSEDGVHVLELRNPPANALSTVLLEALSRALDLLESSPPGALVITGGDGKFFSAGLDLIAVLELDPAGVEMLLSRLVKVLLRIFRLPIPVVAAVNGHAVAGGAILALAAEHRVAAQGDFVVGLNEVQVGLPLPAPLFEIVRSQVEVRELGRVLLAGRNYPVEEARSAGLVHAVADPKELRDHSVALARKLSQVPRAAYSRMKQLLRAEAESRIGTQELDTEFVRIWFEPDTRKAMSEARERLRKRK